MLFELAFHVRQCEFGAIHRQIQFAEDVRKATNMIFVPVRQNDAAHMLPVLEEISDIRNNDVNPEQFTLGKHQAGINDDDIVAPAHGHAVHAELAEATQRHDLQFPRRHNEVRC